MTDAEPFYVYKLIPSSMPVREPIPDRLPVSELDQHSGFIHLSTALQVPNTLKFFFKDSPMVYILRIEYQRVAQDIRWETPNGQVCGPRPKEGLFPVSEFLIVRFLFLVCAYNISIYIMDSSWGKRRSRVLQCGRMTRGGIKP